ncbi:hypothetical protein OAL00_00940 [Verrucomicrobiales bacterium]|nr:hypothetical protein [Verrucomicrobiales bacterium]
MKFSRLLLIAPALTGFGIVGCERHSFEETSQLFKPHGGDHGDGHGDHSDPHAGDHAAEKGHDDHGKKDGHEGDAKRDDHTDKPAKKEAPKKAKGEAKDVGI